MVFEAIREELRRARLDDTDFLTGQTYYFELRVPRESVPFVGGASFVFPLTLAPQQLSIEEFFTVAETETQGGGLYVERNGIIKRTIRMRGTFGFKPKQWLGDAGLALVDPGRRGFNRAVKERVFAYREHFSGQRHFQFLQDAVFRTYSDLLQNPAYANDTYLIWHNPKDDEHWFVEPKRFMSDRDTSKNRVNYPWDIELLAYAPADDIGRTFTEDKDLLDAMRSPFRMINSAINLGRGAVQDITGFIQELDNLVAGVAATVNNFTGLLDDAANVVNGTARLLSSPFDGVNSIATSLATNLEALGNATTALPDTISQSMRQMEDALDRLGQFPQFFQTDTQQRLQAAQRSGELSTSRSRSQLQAAADLGPPNSFQAVLALGTDPLPGDLQKADSELGIGRQLTQYQSATEYVVAPGDTLQGLASRFLGDAREWRAIAVLNDLQAPYVSDTGMPGMVSVGDVLLIPSTNPPPTAQTITPVLGVDPSASGAERLLGTDLKITRMGDFRDTFDLEIDVDGGSVDFQIVAGVPNLAQALLSRIRTEKGTNPLYREVGVDRIVGTRDASLTRNVAVFRIAQAVRADPRVAAVTNLRTSAGNADAISIDFDVQPVSFSGSVAVSFEV